MTCVRDVHKTVQVIFILTPVFTFKMNIIHSVIVSKRFILVSVDPEPIPEAPTFIQVYTLHGTVTIQERLEEPIYLTVFRRWEETEEPAQTRGKRCEAPHTEQLQAPGDPGALRKQCYPLHNHTLNFVFHNI